MIEQILSRLNSIPSDKVFHFAGGALLALASFAAQADSWTGQDKTQHAAAGALIGAAVTASTTDPLKGCAVASAVGLAKEIYDDHNRPRHEPSVKDFVVTAAFGCASAYATGWVITPKEIRYTFRF